MMPATRVAWATRYRTLTSGRVLGSGGILALLSGGLLLIAAPPRDLWPFALVALLPLLHALRGVSLARAVWLGWLCGFVVNLGGFRWAVPLLDDFGQVSLPTRLGVWLLVCAYQAGVFGLWAGATRWLADSARVPWLIAAPLCLVLAESVLPFIFPWHLGLLVWRAWPLTQVAELGGPAAVSALVMLVNVVLYEVWHSRQRQEKLTPAVWRAIVLVLVLVGVGLVRAGQIAYAREHAIQQKVGIVQPNTGIVDIKRREHEGQQLITDLRLATDTLGRQGADLVVWPESAFPFFFDRQLTREYAPSHPWALRSSFRGTLLVGALTHRFGGGSTMYNSAVLVAPNGTVAGTYDKLQLLMFGEYVPFADRYPLWAADVRARLPESPAITPGDGPRLLASGPFKIAPFICYEDLLPGLTYRAAALRPNLLVTLANHAWFGDSETAYQAMALASLRSVELRRDQVRATATGASSFTDALGRTQLRSTVHADVAAADLFLVDVALLDGFALGPFGAPRFPWLCALALFLLVITQRIVRDGWPFAGSVRRVSGKLPESVRDRLRKTLNVGRGVIQAIRRLRHQK